MVTNLCELGINVFIWIMVFACYRFSQEMPFTYFKATQMLISSAHDNLDEVIEYMEINASHDFEPARFGCEWLEAQF
ncbi:MAG: hypothetical protein AAFR81_19390 [Chloroflexota bacterium]